MIESVADAGNSVIAGRQDAIRGTGTVPDNPVTKVLPLLTAIAFAASTVYKFALPVRGASAVRATLRMDSHTGTVPTARLFKTLKDGLTERMSDAGVTEAVAFAALVDDVQKSASITDLRGEAVVVLEITVPAASTTVFDIAEFTTLYTTLETMRYLSLPSLS